MILIRKVNLKTLQQRILATPLRLLLIPLSWLYTVGIQLRNVLYTHGVFKARRLPCRVISVGNITVGGTGKTPTVITIVKYLQREGIRVVVLLRGYKRHAREKVTIVSDGEKVCVSPAESGDEAYMMAENLNGVPVIVGKCRYLAGQVALERFKVDVLLLDDGFQHRQLARDLDILTLSATHPFGSPEMLIPAGTLREPPSSLRRADLILLTHADTPDISEHIKKLVEPLAPNTPVLTSVHQPTHLYPLAVSNQQNSNEPSVVRNMRHSLNENPFTESRKPMDTDSHFSDIKELKGKRILAVCGIGNPEAFVATLMRCSVADVELLAFPDHHLYTETDKQRIYKAFQETSTDLIITTQKDEQKLAGFVERWDLPIAVLGITLVITESDEKFKDVLLNVR
jgi:tetraacyldisaccharide-1-P 4'-kinase